MKNNKLGHDFVITLFQMVKEIEYEKTQREKLETYLKINAAKSNDLSAHHGMVKLDLEDSTFNYL